LAALCTVGINVLALTGPAYMLLLYDRVLPSQDFGELLALTLVMSLLYAVSAGLDLARQFVFARCARHADRRLSARIARSVAVMPVRDLDQIHASLSGPGPAALFDLPWLPLYLLAMFLLHPLFGAAAFFAAGCIGGSLLVAERLSSEPRLVAARTGEQRSRLAAAVAEWLIPTHAAPRRAWLALNGRFRDEQDAAARPAMIASSIVRALRPGLQSATLGLGVYLVMIGACPSASILAASIVLPRVLGPLEIAITHWRNYKAAHASILRLQRLLAPPSHKSALRPSADARGVQIILRRRCDQARNASGARARSMSSGLRPTAE
jgi:ATP-binding cassette subfamily C protein